MNASGSDGSRPDVVGHFLWYDHGDLDHAADVAVAVAPGSLVNHLLNALLVNGVAVDGVGGDHVADFLL